MEKELLAARRESCHLLHIFDSDGVVSLIVMNERVLSRGRKVFNDSKLSSATLAQGLLKACNEGKGRTF